jgi:hypothetical protein
MHHATTLTATLSSSDWYLPISSVLKLITSKANPSKCHRVTNLNCRLDLNASTPQDPRSSKLHAWNATSQTTECVCPAQNNNAPSRTSSCAPRCSSTFPELSTRRVLLRCLNPTKTQSTLQNSPNRPSIMKVCVLLHVHTTSFQSCFRKDREHDHVASSGPELMRSSTRRRSLNHLLTAYKNVTGVRRRIMGGV